MKRSSAAWSRISARKVAADCDSAGLSASRPAFACRAATRSLVVSLRRLVGERVGGVAHERLQVALGLGVERVEQLVEVDRLAAVLRPDLTAVRDLRLVVAARLERQVAVGDARQRRRAKRHHAALVERRELVVDRDLDARARVVLQLDALDRARPGAADLHLVALHELAGVVERDVHAVAAARAEHQDRGCGHRKTEGTKVTARPTPEGRRYLGCGGDAPVGAARGRELAEQARKHWQCPPDDGARGAHEPTAVLPQLEVQTRHAAEAAEG